jgi:hypothetical protein
MSCARNSEWKFIDEYMSPTVLGSDLFMFDGVFDLLKEPGVPSFNELISENEAAYYYYYYVGSLGKVTESFAEMFLNFFQVSRSRSSIAVVKLLTPTIWSFLLIFSPAWSFRSVSMYVVQLPFPRLYSPPGTVQNVRSEIAVIQRWLVATVLSMQAKGC